MRNFIKVERPLWMNEVAQIMQVVGLPNQSQFILEQINDKHVGDLVIYFKKGFYRKELYMK